MATPDWKGLFDWSMKYQDGTKPSAAKQMKEEDRAWFEEAMQHYTMDFVRQMETIKTALDSEEATESEEAVQEKERLLEELMEIVEHIDYARDLTKIGGLETLLALLKSSHASLRSRAAEVAAVCTQINPPVQLYFMQGGALPKLMELLEDSDATCRQKGLLAISCLIRNNATGLSAFLNANGVAKLSQMAESDVPKVQRKALQLLTHIASEDVNAVQAAAIVPPIIKLCSADSRERELQEAALGLLLQLAKIPSARTQIKKDTHAIASLKRRLKQLESTSEGGSEGWEEEQRAQLVEVLRALESTSAAQLGEPRQAQQTFEEGRGSNQKAPLLLGAPGP